VFSERVLYRLLCCGVCYQKLGRLVVGIDPFPSEFKTAAVVSTYQEVHSSLIVGCWRCVWQNAERGSPVRKCCKCCHSGRGGVFVGRCLFSGLFYDFRVNLILVRFWYQHCLFKTCVRNDLCEVLSSLRVWKSYLGLRVCRMVRCVAGQLFPDVQRRRDVSKRQSAATHSAATRQRLAWEAG